MGKVCNKQVGITSSNPQNKKSPLLSEDFYKFGNYARATFPALMHDVQTFRRFGVLPTSARTV